MFDFLKKNNKAKAQYNALEQEMKEIQERFFAFVERLEIKLKEFAEASLPELEHLGNTDTDEYKRGYHRMKAAVTGQIATIREKAYHIIEEKVLPFRDASGYYYQFRETCYARYDKLEKLCDHYREKVEHAYTEDYEAAYQAILDEHEMLKSRFACSQCGSKIVIDKIYFTTTYLTCSACQTQNTFEPSSKAKSLEHLGRSLAAQRTKHLLEAYNSIAGKMQALYQQKHHLEIGLHGETDKKIIKQKQAQISLAEQQWKELDAQKPLLYQAYLRAMFGEWNKINPAMAGEHEKFYTRLLNEYNSTNKK